MEKKPKKVIVPARYTGHPLRTCIWKNLNQFIRYEFDENYDSFLDEFEKRLKERKLTAKGSSQPKSKRTQLRQGYVNTEKASKLISPEMADLVGKAFDFTGEGLKTPRKISSTVYVLVKSKGNDATQLVKFIRKNPNKFKLVDEATLITGEYSVYLRLHGTIDELEDFLTQGIYKIKNVEVQGTNTITTVGHTYYQRYPPKDHTNYRYRRPTFVKKKLRPDL